MPDKRLPQTYDDATIDLFTSAAHAHGYTHKGGYNEFLHAILSDPGRSPLVTVETFYQLLDLSQQEQERLHMLLEERDMDMASFLRRLLLQELDRADRQTKRLYDLDLSDPEERQRRAGAGYLYLTHVLDALIAANLQATDWWDKRYITAKLLEKRSGSSPQLIRRFLRDYADKLQKHHEAMGWHTLEDGMSFNHQAGKKQRDLAREARKAARQSDGAVEAGTYAETDES